MNVMENTKDYDVAHGVKWVGIPDYDLVSLEVVGTTDKDLPINLPPVYRLFASISLYQNYRKLAGSFDSSGWRNGKTVEINLTALKFRYLCENFFIKFSTSEDNFKTTYDYDVAFGKQLQCA